MHRLRQPQWVLITLFLAILALVPLVQLALEIRQDGHVRALDLFGQPPTAANLRAYERSLESVNWAARASRPWMQFAQFAWLREGGSKLAFGQDGWYFYKPSVNYLLNRPGHVEDPLPAIVDFRDQLAARGIQLLVMPVPNKESIYPDRLAAGATPPAGNLAPPTRDLLERLKAAHVDVVDLFTAFREARQPGGAASEVPLYLAQDTHWSPTGMKLAAQVAARRLCELGWLQPGTLDYTERAVATNRLGDIVRMLQAPSIERAVAPEAVTCQQVFRRDTGALFQEDPSAELLVLGDSFQRIYQRDTPEAAGFIAHLAKELKQPLMGLVNDGGGSTLVREELRNRLSALKYKKVVLWEFVERDIALGLNGWKIVALPATTKASVEPQKSAAIGH